MCVWGVFLNVRVGVCVFFFFSFILRFLLLLLSLPINTRKQMTTNFKFV